MRGNQPAQYMFFMRHPGSATVAGMGASTLQTKLVPARRVVHPKLTKRLEQSRGVTCLHGILNRIDDIKEGEESERVAMRIAAALCAVIAKGDLAGPGQTTTGNRSFKMKPGMIFDNLQPGEKVETIDSKRPNTQIIDFLRWNLRAMCAGAGARYSNVARDYSGTYSSQRQELVEAKIGTKRLLTYFVGTFYPPIRAQFLTAAVLNGDLQLNELTDVATLTDAEYRGPAIPWMDPKKEMEGY